MFDHILYGGSLKFRPETYALYIVGTSNESDPESWPMNRWYLLILLVEAQTVYQFSIRLFSGIFP